ncbi:MAG: hypothetical protein NTY94_18105 [Alphaproteobacteria bacterium]|nr:hypothetical protein [Alphaproteobacteria bacterium]
MGGRQDAFELGRGGSVPGEERQQGEQELEQGRRNMDAIHRLRHAAQGVGFVRGGGSVWHHHKHYATQQWRATENLPYMEKC